MPIEIKELVIKVQIKEPSIPNDSPIDLTEIKQLVRSECKKEIKKQLAKNKHR